VPPQRGTAVPWQTPAPLHWSPYVHPAPSLQAVPIEAFAVTTQAAVPLHESVWHAVLVHAIGVPTQCPTPSQ
jgi:hypothetical protein